MYFFPFGGKSCVGKKTASEIKNEEELLPCRLILWCVLYNELPAETEEACAAVGRRTSWGTVGRKNKRCSSSFSSSGRQSEQGSWQTARVPAGAAGSGLTSAAAGRDEQPARSLTYQGGWFVLFTGERWRVNHSKKAPNTSEIQSVSAAPTASWMFSDNIPRLQTFSIPLWCRLRQNRKTPAEKKLLTLKVDVNLNCGMHRSQPERSQREEGQTRTHSGYFFVFCLVIIADSLMFPPYSLLSATAGRLQITH